MRELYVGELQTLLDTIDSVMMLEPDATEDGEPEEDTNVHIKVGVDERVRRGRSVNRIDGGRASSEDAACTSLMIVTILACLLSAR
jgi:translation initiation factor 1 (eIF-1/SUI1)